MLVIRLQKVGKIHTATFRVVVTQKTAAAKRKYLELLGNVNRKTKAVSLNKDRILYWISKGAQPSDTIQFRFIKFLKKYQHQLLDGFFIFCYTI